MNEEPYKICLRLNADEAQKLITNAKACGLTRTAYLRRLLNGYDLKPRPSAEMEALRTEIHQIGNNINQIARRLNEGRVRGEQAVLTGSEKAEIRALAGLVFTIADQVQEMSRNRRVSLKLEVDKALAPLIREARDGAG